MTISKVIPIHIIDLDISIRCRNVLQSNNITLVSQLQNMTLDEINHLPYAGKNSITEIKELFINLGLTFKN
jgi:DNA-directed RNA polymerase alpha subunit